MHVLRVTKSNLIQLLTEKLHTFSFFLRVFTSKKNYYY